MARGAAATVAALAGRVLQGAQQQAPQHSTAPGQQAEGQSIADMPYQQLQQQVCEHLMGPAGAQQQPLPPAVLSALAVASGALERRGLQAPEPSQ